MATEKRNGVSVELVETRDGTYVKLTGEFGSMLISREDWSLFTTRVTLGQLSWSALTADRRYLATARRIAGKVAVPDESRRTPENLAYVNGRYAEKSGWVPYTLAMFARKFNLNPDDPETEKLYRAFQTGRQAEAHDASIAEGN